MTPNGVNSLFFSSLHSIRACDIAFSCDEELLLGLHAGGWMYVRHFTYIGS